MLHRRRFLSLLIVAFGLFLATSPADAARKWCHKDPVMSVAGTRVNVDVAVYDDEKHLVTGPVVVKFFVPPGTQTAVIATDDGFNGYGETVTVEVDKRLKATTRSVQIRVLVKIPSKGRLAAQVVISPGTAKPIAISGRTNTEFSATTSVTPSK
jgi:hypothetical protein